MLSVLCSHWTRLEAQYSVWRNGKGKWVTKNWYNSCCPPTQHTEIEKTTSVVKISHNWYHPLSLKKVLQSERPEALLWGVFKGPILYFNQILCTALAACPRMDPTGRLSQEVCFLLWNGRRSPRGQEERPGRRQRRGELLGSSLSENTRGSSFFATPMAADPGLKTMHITASFY